MDEVVGMKDQWPDGDKVWSWLLAVGGPLDGQLVRVPKGVSRVDVGGVDVAGNGYAYHRTRPTDTNWRETYDHDWFMHGLPEAPPVPDHVLEWHARSWQSPEVASIRAAIEEVAYRVFGEERLSE